MVIPIIRVITCVIVLHQSHSLTIKQPNVCRSETTGDLQCCFNYEYKDDSCIECKIGLTSGSGSPCLPCDENQYGLRCLKRCKCKHFQRCDNVVGCLDISISTEQKSTEIKEAQTTELNIKTTEVEIYMSTRTNDKDLSLTNEKDKVNEVKIGTLVGLFLAYMFIVHIVCFCMYKKLKVRRIVITNGNVYDEIGTVHYNAVSVLPITVTESSPSIGNSQVSRVGEALDLNDEHNVSEIESEKTDTSSEGYDDTVADIDDEVQMQQSITIRDSDGYEHPYNSLIPPSQIEHPYNECLITLETVSEEHDQTDSRILYLQII